MKNKKAAMEMSVGTIVTIVLLMSVLVLSLMLVKNIFTSSKGAVDLTDEQLNAELQKLFSEDKKVVLFPTSGQIKLKIGETGAVGVGIKNIATSMDSGSSFSYKTEAIENDCGLTQEQMESIIRLGKERDEILVPVGDSSTGKITFLIPEGFPNCLIDFKVDVFKNSQIYGNQGFTVQVKA